ncbi:hypothetical protein Tco_0823588 [Tanacetum coccineum]|uniref:Uncharacterized protein n=1 Tax=Tanacetum coccineum TaxID=301880 RepID=A0ABQ5AK42_9ASTR
MGVLNLSLTLRSLNLYSGILCCLAILCLYPHARYLKSLLTIYLNIDLLLDLLAILSLMFFEEVLGFAAALAVLVTGASQSRQHDKSESDSTIYLIESSIHLLNLNRYTVDKSLIHIESRKSPTVELFDVDSGRISIFTVNTKEYHSDVLENITRIMRRTLAQAGAGYRLFNINDLGMRMPIEEC